MIHNIFKRINSLFNASESILYMFQLTAVYDNIKSDDRRM